MYYDDPITSSILIFRAIIVQRSAHQIENYIFLLLFNTLLSEIKVLET